LGKGNTFLENLVLVQGNTSVLRKGVEALQILPKERRYERKERKYQHNKHLHTQIPAI